MRRKNTTRAYAFVSHSYLVPRGPLILQYACMQVVMWDESILEEEVDMCGRAYHAARNGTVLTPSLLVLSPSYTQLSVFGPWGHILAISFCLMVQMYVPSCIGVSF